MHCPKCKDSFEEGSRRFCPNDGSRLVSGGPEVDADPAPRPGGIFANLIPKIDALGERDETLAPRNDRALERSRGPFDDAQGAGMPFFELDDPELEIDGPVGGVYLPPQTSASESEPRPGTRKVQPDEIPAGHVNLDEENRFPSPAADFTLDNPERFIGRTVKGRYRVTEFLGGDETGFSYLGDDRLVEDRKVLVRILIEDGFDEIMSSILAEERVSLSHFSHPNIARMIDSGEFSNGLNFLVSEYVDALSVDDILTIHGQFDPQRTGRVIRQAASALNEAHQEGIIHRDVRPQNLVIDTLGEIEQVRVVNFGASNGDPSDFNLPYKAPEVLEGRIATVASDIYSLAVVAYEMLTGTLPFEGDSEKGMLRAQHAGIRKQASNILEGISPAVDEVFEKALAFNATERYPKARDLGDALSSALTQPARTTRPVEVDEPIAEPPVPAPIAERRPIKSSVVSLEPVGGPAIVPALPVPEKPAERPTEPTWRNRSPEPPETGGRWSNLIPVFLILAILAAAAVVWYVSTANNGAPVTPQQPEAANAANPSPANTNSNGAETAEMPPLPRTIAQPPDTNYYQNSKQDLRGELLRNFVGFSLFYPKTWKVNGPQGGSSANARGKFLDISHETPDGRILEQMLISYFPSKGTFDLDSESFPKMVKETNETLKKILPGYQMVSEGETRVNGNWRAYEVKFQSSGTTATGEKLSVWGRRLFIPAARPGTRNGFEITMLATSYAEGLTGVNDVGVKGDLSTILDTFEPTQNF
jgi:serine/threonine protein kinase